MDAQLTDPVIVNITAHKIFKTCFKKVFKGRNDIQAGEEELQNLKQCSKNIIDSFSVVSEGYQNYVSSVITPTSFGME